MYRISPTSTDLLTINNINFVLDLKSWQIVHLDSTLSGLLKLPISLNSEWFYKIVHEDDRELVIQAYNQLDKGTIIGLLKFRIWVDAEINWLAVMPLLANNGEGKLLLANATIITQEVENLDTTLKFANKKNSILQMLSHDLRGPLLIAKSLIEVVNSYKMPKTNAIKINAISDIIEQTINMITDLVNKEFLATIDAPLVKKKINVVKKLTEYIEQCKKAEHINGRKFNLVSSSDYVALWLDESKFMQVVNNLVSNSLKFTHTNGHISISVEEQDNGTFITFKDDGVGIPEALQPYIFDRYTISKREGLSGEPTTGLGLFIVKEILTWHNATIACHSKENVGSVFTIQFPK